ncbi:hydrogenase/urease maturation nickel metallochaperone HypA [Planctomycetota bacterium]
MHEAMVAQNVLLAITRESKQRHAKPVHAKISCGQLNTLHKDVFCLAFEALAQETCCADMTFDVEQKPFQATCNNCECTFAVVFSTDACPACASSSFTLLPDAPLLLETIDFQEE